MVHPLTDKLNRGLSEVDLSLWHVQVINEDDEFLTSGRSENTLPAFLELFVKTVLGLIS